MPDSEMPKYQCHKIVHALKIGALMLSHTPDGTSTLFPDDDRFGPFQVVNDWVRKHQPEVGGYYVVYEDGYASYSPAAAFDAGYTRIGNELGGDWNMAQKPSGRVDRVEAMRTAAVNWVLQYAREQGECDHRQIRSFIQGITLDDNGDDSSMAEFLAGEEQ